MVGNRIRCFESALSNLKTIGELPANTIISSLCIYILYGVFIGYSISFEAAELQTKDESTDFQTANK